METILSQSSLTQVSGKDRRIVMNADCSAVPPQPTQTRQVLDSRKQMGVATEPLCPLVLSEVESLISISWLLVKLECDILNFIITLCCTFMREQS